MKTGRKAAAALILSAIVLGLSGCQRAWSDPFSPQQKPGFALGFSRGRRAQEDETVTLSMAAGAEGSTVFSAGAAVASAINNGGVGIHVSIETSRGALVDIKNLSEGTVDLAMISGDAAFDAKTGIGAFEGVGKEGFLALGACYPEGSQWIARKDSGLTWVHELNGKRISAGARASATERASEAAASVVDLDGEETEWSACGLSDGADGLRNGTLDAAHGFARFPSEAFEVLAGETETALLKYTEAELAEILAFGAAKGRPYCRLTVPAGAYPGQEEAYDTFGIKVLLCADASLEEELAYGIAKALDEKGPEYTAGHRFMALMQDKEFLSGDLPIPLHPGAERYYREMGYME